MRCFTYMRRIKYLNNIVQLFSFKTILDNENNEYVILNSSQLSKLDTVYDKTQFEFTENHIHILEKINKREFKELDIIAKQIGKALLQILKYNFPDKYFYVFVTISLNDSMIVRFHQKWSGEMPFCNPEEYESSNEKVLVYEG